MQCVYNLQSESKIPCDWTYIFLGLIYNTHICTRGFVKGTGPLPVRASSGFLTDASPTERRRTPCGSSSVCCQHHGRMLHHPIHCLKLKYDAAGSYLEGEHRRGKNFGFPPTFIIYIRRYRSYLAARRLVVAPLPWTPNPGSGFKAGVASINRVSEQDARGDILTCCDAVCHTQRLEAGRGALLRSYPAG